uniref:Uncharacterized protein n=1 Tax=Candidatus Kentrum sp. LFY TaxID=2126342 RepID=A0A450UI53_9GAMM|nr:MAG: hypothetical protein BECKLFY1418A_GA0070994_102128 [Candidatus Kentron sp. LFY]
MNKTKRNKRNLSKILYSLWFVLATIILFVVFWFPPLKLHEGGLSHGNLDSNAVDSQITNQASKLSHDGIAFSILGEEHKKVAAEIKLLQALQDEWFHNKFLLIGILVFGFVAHTLIPYFRKPNRKDEHPALDTDGILNHVLSPGITLACTVLALACVVSFMIDIHIRNYVSSSIQAGLWIRHHVEEPILGNKTENDIKGWETFLYNPCKKKNSEECKERHSDHSYRTSWSHFHALTWLVYIIYMTLLFDVWKSHTDRRILWLGFALVHLSLMGFSWMAHSPPSGFQSQTWPLIEGYDSYYAPLQYVALCAVLVGVNILYFKWYSGRDRDVGTGQEAP